MTVSSLHDSDQHHPVRFCDCGDVYISSQLIYVGLVEFNHFKTVKLPDWAITSQDYVAVQRF